VLGLLENIAIVVRATPPQPDPLEASAFFDGKCNKLPTQLVPLRTAALLPALFRCARLMGFVFGMTKSVTAGVVHAGSQ
jgi:hypothetical protein